MVWSVSSNKKSFMTSGEQQELYGNIDALMRGELRLNAFPGMSVLRDDFDESHGTYVRCKDRSIYLANLLHGAPLRQILPSQQEEY